MTAQEALQNVINTLTLHRASQGHPSEIHLRSGGTWHVVEKGWSKSAINNNTETVFLFVAPSPEVADLLTEASLIRFGRKFFQVSGNIKQPKETTGYWQLPVVECGL